MWTYDVSVLDDQGSVLFELDPSVWIERDGGDD
jgi:hypothetical protein